MRNMAKFVSTKINLTKINFLIGNFMSNNKQFFNCTHGYTGGALWKHKGWSRADLRLVYRFWGHLIWSPKFKKGRKIKHKVLYKNKKLPSVTTQFQSWFNTVMRMNDSKKTFSEHLEALILEIFTLCANHGGASGWPLTCYNFIIAQIRAPDQSLKFRIKMEPWGTPVLTGYSCEDFSFSTTWTHLLLRKDKIISNAWPEIL